MGGKQKEKRDFVKSKWMKLGAFNLWIVFLAVCLYSPGLIGLSPAHENILIAASSITTGVMLTLIFFMVNWYLLAGKKTELIQMGDENLKEKVVEVMRRRTKNKDLDKIGKVTVAQLERLDVVKENFQKLVERRFKSETLSYKKFMGAMEKADFALINGYIKMTTKVMIIDEPEYVKFSLEEYQNDVILDDIQEEKKKLYHKSLESMRNILRENEKILLRLDHLMLEISDTDYSEQNVDYAVEEINNLIAQLQFYC
ncbi:hypothetical protein VSQ48_04815 [Candidatus Ventrimonas sp. KK005]|nr:hypothetical protein [Lachnospiraceae bacterium]